MEAVIASNLSKRFGKATALEGVNFTVERNSIFGIIGPDGAGKSTLLRILSTLTVPDSGNVTIDGINVQTGYQILRKRIGYMPETFSLYQDLTVEENLEFYASIFNVDISSNYYVIAPVFRQLEPFRRRRAGKLSGGMKQKLALSCALIHQPSILLLDEPTRGVDPVSRKEFWDILAGIKAKGITIVLSTSYMDEASLCDRIGFFDHGKFLLSTSYMDEASLCDRIGFFDHGKFLLTGTPQEIIDGYGNKIYSIECCDKYAVLLAARQWKSTESCYINGDTLHITFTDGNTEMFKEHILATTGETIKITETTPTIEDCFMAISK